MVVGPFRVFLLVCLPVGGPVDNTRLHLDLDCNRSVDVAIVGAGPSGTYFAYKLREAGLNIELLEYSDRIGGRMFTTSLPNIPDVNIELGAMRFIEGKHTRVQNLVKELNLSPIEFLGGASMSEKTKYFFRKKLFDHRDLQTGQVPYILSAEEKENQGTLVRHYIHKLTGYTGPLEDEKIFKMRTKDGRELYKLSMNEALNVVATAEGRSFLKETATYDGGFEGDVSSLEYFAHIDHQTDASSRVLTLKEGMDSIPKSLVRYFLDSSNKHRMTFNRKLEAINSRIDGRYQLQFLVTRTVHGSTIVEGPEESVCAKKVVLALPHLALTQLKWKALRLPKMKDALHAMIPVKANKIFLTFPKAWWLNDTTNRTFIMKSDFPFRKMYNWESSTFSGESVMLASYADSDSTAYMENLNTECGQVPGSLIGGNKVSECLKQDLINQLAQSFDVNRSLIPEPTSAISQFWTTYPYSGGWTTWKAGYNFSDIIQTIRRPSLIDDVYFVGSDYGIVGSTMWTEGALRITDEVYERYFP